MSRVLPPAHPSTPKRSIREFVQQRLATAVPAQARRGHWEPLFVEVYPLMERGLSTAQIVDDLVAEGLLKKEDHDPALWALQRRRRNAMTKLQTQPSA